MALKRKPSTKRLKRNRGKFPPDFLLELTLGEMVVVNRSQFVTGSRRHRDQRTKPFAFTEHGALMAATILNSPQATQTSVFVMRAFVKMRSPADRHARAGEEARVTGNGIEVTTRFARDSHHRRASTDHAVARSAAGPEGETKEMGLPCCSLRID